MGSGVTTSPRDPSCWNCGAPVLDDAGRCDRCGLGTGPSSVPSAEAGRRSDPAVPSQSLPWKSDTRAAPHGPPGARRRVEDAAPAAEPPARSTGRRVDVDPGAAEPGEVEPAWSAEPASTGVPRATPGAPTAVAPPSATVPHATLPQGGGPPPGPRPPTPGRGAAGGAGYSAVPPAAPPTPGGPPLGPGFGPGLASVPTSSRQPVPLPTLAPGIASGTAVTGGKTFVGIVDGPVAQDVRVFRFWGSKVLMPVLVATAVAVLVVEAPRIAAVARALLPIFILIAAAWLVLALIVGGTFGTMMGSGMAKSTAAVAGAMGRSAVGAARGAHGVARHGSVVEQVLPLRRFRVRSPAGVVQSCVLVGEIEGDDVRQGDVVVVHGRLRRDGHRSVVRVDVQAGVGGPTGAVVRARKPAVFRVTQALDVVARVASALLGLVLVGLVVSVLT